MAELTLPSCTQKETFCASAFKEGALLLMDKPYEKSSFWVVKRVRGILKKHYGFKKLKVGHSGTLDPLATGLLVLCTGKYTKKLTQLIGLAKCYTGVIELGKTTPSFDLETPFDSEFGADTLSPQDIEKEAKKFIGDNSLAPPLYSAKKIDGVRAYEYARQNADKTLAPVKMSIDKFLVNVKKLPDIDFEVHCASGTYIRSLAHQFGQNLGCGAYLKKLHRTSIGHYTVNQAISIETFEQWVIDSRVDG